MWRTAGWQDPREVVANVFSPRSKIRLFALTIFCFSVALWSARSLQPSFPNFARYRQVYGSPVYNSTLGVSVEEMVCPTMQIAYMLSSFPKSLQLCYQTPIEKMHCSLQARQQILI